MLRQQDIRRRFDNAAATFDDVDFVHAVTRNGVLARLEPVVLDASVILDLGSATGATGRQLRKRFRRTRVVSVDLSAAMLRQAQQRKTWFTRSSFVQADACQLPFRDACFDLVVANQLLPWIPDPQLLFGEAARVLKKGGLFAFATLGPDSLQEIANAWAKAEVASKLAPASHVNAFADMHDIGDGLVRAGLRDPVLDVDRLTVSYESTGKLLDDLTRAGARNSLAARTRGLTGKHGFRAMARALETATPGPGLSLELELVYGHCWGGEQRDKAGDVRIAAKGIPLRR